jgi:hypothetical protein
MTILSYDFSQFLFLGIASAYIAVPVYLGTGITSTARFLNLRRPLPLPTTTSFQLNLLPLTPLKVLQLGKPPPFSMQD